MQGEVFASAVRDGCLITAVCRLIKHPYADARLVLLFTAIMWLYCVGVWLRFPVHFVSLGFGLRCSGVLVFNSLFHAVSAQSLIVATERN